MTIEESRCFAGLILAGGEGSRFGGPKAWVVLPDGRTFLEACAATLQTAGAGTVAATLPPGSVDPGIPGLTWLSLASRGLDMFASLRAGLQRMVGELEWTRVAVLPVDHPFVKPATVVALAACKARVAIPRYRGKHGHPVVLDRATAEAVANGRLPGPTLREVLKTARPVDVEVDDPGAVANCNTPDTMASAWSAVR
jgi:CTP:molybdopterin cytidylyltransferase MocA